jgi:hypothetical protein
MFVLCEWAEKADVFEERFQKWHLCLLLIQFGVGYLTWRNSSDQQSFLNIIKVPLPSNIATVEPD